jgi:hypothetical protein
MSISKLLRRVIDVIIFGIASSIAAFLLALLLTRVWLKISVYDTMFYIGVLVAVLGGLSLGRGSPTAGANLGGQTNLQGNSQYNSYANLMKVGTERRITNYYESTKDHAQFYFTSSRLNVFLNGAMIVLSSFVLSWVF